MTTRADIVATARSYKGTPFHHMERKPGLGMDCAGVLICCARDLGLVPQAFDVPAYIKRPDGTSLLEWCRRYMGAEVSQRDLLPGHAILAAIGPDPAHLGVVGDYRHGGLSIIHASNMPERMRVIETRLMFTRVLKFTAGFNFPQVTD